MYATYARATLRSRFLSGLYNVLFVACLVVVLPAYVILLHGHLDIDAHGKGYVQARLANPPGELACGKDVLGNGSACEVWDWLEAVNVRGGEMFLTTFVQEELQVRRCPRSAESCASAEIWATVNATEYYLAGPEKLRMLLDHRYVAHGVMHTGQRTRGVALTGSVAVEKDDEDGDIHVHRDYDCARLREGLRLAPDVGQVRVLPGARTEIKVSHMVKAGGQHMKHRLVHAPEALEGINATLRRWGGEFHVDVFYSNLWRAGVPDRGSFESAAALVSPRAPHYQVCVTSNPSPDPVRTITTHATTPTFAREIARRADAARQRGDPHAETRVRRRAYGLRVHLNVDGRVAKFSWVQLCVFTVSALVLLNVPFTLIETLLYLPAFTRRPWYADMPGRGAAGGEAVFCKLIDCDTGLKKD